MPNPIPPDQLDLSLAWRRATGDLASRRAFARHPFHDALISSELDPWLAGLARSLRDGTYHPHSCRVVQVPKPSSHIRPGADLHLEDQVVFAALLQQMRQRISAALGDPAHSPDYSYHLRADEAHADWFAPIFPRWRAFDHDSLAEVANGAVFVVVADIAGYYENIDLNTLRSDLNGLGVDAMALNLLMDCLHRWARVQRRGVPQGHSPADVLAKLYLHPVDLTLAAEGFRHRRWVDDFRIVCPNEAAARKALVILADALGRRGLVLQASKSRILTADAARAKFATVATALDPIQTALAVQLHAVDGEEPSYLTPWEVDAGLAAAGAEGAIEVLRTALVDNFLTAGQQFNKTLFHYLLRRLAAAEDGHHAPQVISLLRDVPEECDHIAEYARAVGAAERFEEAFLAGWTEGIFPYPYMGYQFLRWRLREDRPVNQRLRTWVRPFAFEGGHPWYLRSAARTLLGKLGDTADLERLEGTYAEAQYSLEKAEILCCLQRMEAGRRNALYGRAAADGELQSQAVRLARGGALDWCAC